MAGYKYFETVVHNGLGKTRVISGSDPYIVKQKAKNQMWEWEVQWEKVQEKEFKRAEKEAAYADAEAKKLESLARTQEAQTAFDGLSDILKATLCVNDAIEWEKLKDKTAFPELPPRNPVFEEMPREPKPSDDAYMPKLNILDQIIPSWKQKKEAKAKSEFETALRYWKIKCEGIRNINLQAQVEFEGEMKDWENRKIVFEKQQEESNRLIESRQEVYYYGDPAAIFDYCDLVLSNSEYPEWMPGNWELDYKPETKLLIIELQLPDPSGLPRLKEVKYVKTKDEFVESYYPDSTISKVYDNLLYQICLRTLHEIYEADVIDAIKYIVFNGIVESIDKSVGKKVTACIMSIQVEKEQFLDIELGSVDPKACFRKLKGISSSSLAGLAAIPPVMQIDRSDSRFIDARAVVDGINAGTNIASMDWADFEHLIRELFEKEFTQSGGEVKVTQASRDGGVDAIAFDPDPIRGGKIVIQAKRYTGTVGVSAVRDLYGTVVNEGATKGILITTSDYGPDSYEFAKAKPLTLLNGNNLLHLLANHGYKARIDIQEARQTLKAEGR